MRRLRYYSNISRVRGMKDEFQKDIWFRQAITSVLRREAERFSFEEVQTPIVEKKELFVRGIGADTEVVSKELYCMQDDLALRPENTAGAVRALVENGYRDTLPVRWYYEGEMFRRERPQRGRWRQFRQFGVEMFCRNDLPSKISSDLELILMANNAIKELEVENVTLTINTLGDSASRTAYGSELKKYLQNHKSDLSEFSVDRLERGSVLRILDSKDEADQQVLLNGPVIEDSLSEHSLNYWKELTRSLKNLQIDFTHNHRLVRGLNYYQDTVFEFVCQSDLLGKSQATILAGGRYDGLVQGLSGTEEISGAGWSLGVDRILLVTKDVEREKRRPVFVVTTLGSKDIWFAVHVLNQIGKRDAQLLVGHNFGKLTKKADQRNASDVVFVGEDELHSGTVKVKNMQSGKEENCDVVQLRNKFESV